MDFFLENWLLIILGLLLAVTLVFLLMLGRRGQPITVARGNSYFKWLHAFQQFYLSRLALRQWTVNIIGAILILWFAQSFSVWIQPALTPADIFPPPFSGPKAVRIQMVDTGPVVRTATYTGVVEPYERNEVFARVDGFVEQLPVHEGDWVRKGSLLSRLDISNLESQLRKMVADSTYRHAEWVRAKALYAESAISASNLDNARKMHETASAAVGQIRTQISYASIRAKISGWIVERRVYSGQYVHKGEKILRVDRLDSIRVKFNVSERDLAFIHKEDRVWIEFPQVPMLAFDVEVWKGQIQPSGGKESFLEPATSSTKESPRPGSPEKYPNEIPGLWAEVAVVYQAEDPITHTGTVEIQLPNPGTLLKSGAYVVGHFAVERVEAAVRVPSRAIIQKPDGVEVVYLGPAFADEGAAEIRDVIVGLRADAYSQILSGLEPSEFVIYSGQRNLVDGQLVSVVHRVGPS